MHVHSHLRKNIKNVAVPGILSKVYFLNILSLRSWLKKSYTHPKAISSDLNGKMTVIMLLVRTLQVSSKSSTLKK